MLRREDSTKIPPVESGGAQAIRVAILERLSMLATPETANNILRTALVRAATRFVPDRVPHLGEFVSGALYHVTATELGVDAADALMDDLAILVKAAAAAIGSTDEDSHVRATLRPIEDSRTPVVESSEFARERSARDLPAVFGTPIPTLAPPAESRVALRVVVASRDSGRFDEVVDELGHDADVHRVSDVFELVDAASAWSDGPVIVLVDRESSVMRTSTLAAASDELPEHAHVVLWGDGAATNDELPDLIPAPDSWTRVHGETTPREVAMIVRRVGNERLSRIG